MPPAKNSKAASSHPRAANSRWVRCPRSPCLVSFNPRSALRHASACRYFRCSNPFCSYFGTQRQVGDHESGCPLSLPSEDIGTTDPLSESPSQVLDILTSPNPLHSYPTDPSSAYFSETSPPKCPSSMRSQRVKPPTRFQSSKAFIAPQTSTQLKPIPSASSMTKRHHQQIPRRTLDPYDSSAQRVFSMPIESINPSLRPAPAPLSKCSSPSPPPPPTRRLSTYELQRYCPDPQSTQAGPSHSHEGPPDADDNCAAASAHKTDLYEALKKCYQSLLYSYDDYVFLVSQKVTQPGISEEIVGPAIDDFRQAYQSFLVDQVPDLTFLNQIDHSVEEGCPDDSIPKDMQQQESPDSLAEESLTADQLADQVRVKIAELKRRSPAGMDSPGNVFSRKRPRNESALTYTASSPNPQRPTQFMQKLADTTWELCDEIKGNLPSRCNFKKVIDAAHHKIDKKVRSRKSH